MFTDGVPNRRNVYYYTLSKMINKCRYCKKRFWWSTFMLILVAWQGSLSSVTNKLESKHLAQHQCSKTTSHCQTGVQSTLAPDTINWTGVWLLQAAAASQSYFYFVYLFCFSYHPSSVPKKCRIDACLVGLFMKILLFNEVAIFIFFDGVILP